MVPSLNSYIVFTVYHLKATASWEAVNFLFTHLHKQAKTIWNRASLAPTSKTVNKWCLFQIYMYNKLYTDTLYYFFKCVLMETTLYIHSSQKFILYKN